MKRTEIFALIIAGKLAIPSIIFFYLGYLELVDIVVAYLYTSAAAIAAVLVWGFKNRIFSKLGESNSNPKATGSKKPPNYDDGYVMGTNNKKPYRSKLNPKLRELDDLDKK